MGELIRYHIVILVQTDIGGIITELVSVLIVVGYGQNILFASETMPV